mmetsp:Transcript_58875/g.70217  ORF Transcript_58875/g.70217 Transcript_58875/m.70217 type:complete len:234 (+) Transcript_58875:128-829(+)|eukprot:CAMPEP_0172510236 /NCGR_PEP_ID=MMETSP1066-20121228/227189_1 /TAXON_ID=671091 /ORGANISM="Coscinodiscus wailesii, Strain CCMP2513" /LENGTH=233 /DNA_ID=CAMNT_0013289107 /DNA_START=123 /DNA_END=824 /DNA_ORIENTATION=-
MPYHRRDALWTFMLFASYLSLMKNATGSKSTSATVQLTQDNFDELTKGKTVFIKFFSPDCGFCQDLAPIWEKLAKLWRNDTIGLIGEVDCTDESSPTAGKSLCTKYKVVGLPTLLYGDPREGLEEYTGINDYLELWEFSRAHLVPICHATNPDACGEKERENIERFWRMSEAELDNAIDVLEGEVKDVDVRAKEKLKEMTKGYDELMLNKELEVAKIKGNIRLMEAVRKLLQK